MSTKKTCCIAVRLNDEDFGFLAEVAAHMQLPTDGHPIIGRAVQQIIRLMRSSFPADAVAGQGMLCKPCLQGVAA